MNNDSDIIYKVVVNNEEQYSIWIADKKNALGWKDEGEKWKKRRLSGLYQKKWKNMRPLSIRVK